MHACRSTLEDPTVKACRDLPGHELFQYIDEDGNRQSLGSADVNDYLRAVTGQDFTAKDFRTWAGTVLVAKALSAAVATDDTKKATKRRMLEAIEAAADRLGNTRTVCRKSYIHPAVLDAYMDGCTIAPKHHGSREPHALSAEERAVVSLLKTRVAA